MVEFFLKNKYLNRSFDFSGSDIFPEIKDADYLIFIREISNGGFFLAQSLLIYPHTLTATYPDIKLVNKSLNEEFADYFDELISFGQDIFGNQFCFDMKDSKVVFFNIEDASRSEMGNNFRAWMEIFIDDYDYYSGYTYAKAWQSNHTLEFDQRLCPKKPFSIGGDYLVENFYPLNYPAYLKLNADIAKQLHNLPDGTKVQLSIIPKSSNE